MNKVSRFLRVNILVLSGFLFFSFGENGISGELTVYIWESYLNPECYEQFEAKTGIKVKEITYVSNEEMYDNIKLHPGQYDIIVPSDYMLSTLIKENRLATIHASSMENFSNLDNEFLNMSSDPKAEFGIPYLWGVSGIGYNDKYFTTPPASWSYLFEPHSLQKIKGKVSSLDDMREVIGAALLFLGNNPNTTDPLEIQKVKYILSQQNQFLSRRDSEHYEAALTNEEIVLAHGWSGDVFVAQAENPHIHFVLPKEGTFLFMDHFAVLSDAPRKDEAIKFINFMLDARVAAANATYVMYPTPNAAAREFISEEHVGAAFNLPVGYKVFSIRDIGSAVVYYDRLWKEVVA